MKFKMLNQKSYIPIIGACIMLMLSYSCKKDKHPCDMPRDGVNYILGDTIKAFFANYIGAQKVIFINSMGEEKAFDLSEINDTVGSYAVSHTCASDNSRLQSVEGTAQIMNLSFSIEDLMDPVFLYLVHYPELPEMESFEAIEITLGELFSTQNPLDEEDALFSFAPNKSFNTVTISDSLLLNGKMYFDVIEMNGGQSAPKLTLKVTKQEGIVYIKNNANGMEYFYDRKE